MILFTEGPNMLFIRTSKPKTIASGFETSLLDITKHSSPEEAFAHTPGKNTIIFITEADKMKTRIKDAIFTFSAPWGADITISYLYNHELLNNVKRIDLGPGIIFLKAINQEQIALLDKKISTSIYSHKFPFEKGVEVGEVQDTIIYITCDNLSRPVSINLDTPVVLLHIDKYQALSFIEKNIIKLFMETISEDLLKEIGISIYDHYNLYDIHRQRIYTVLTDLSLGFILGEQFTTDSPRFLMKIIVYLIKLLTPESIEKIKWYMLGLEFLENGKRVCDIDILHKGKKLSWRDLPNIPHRGRKEEIAMQAREELLANLSNEAKTELMRLDEILFQKILDLSS